MKILIILLLVAVAVDQCSGERCQNGGTRDKEADEQDLKCICTNRWTGKHCDIPSSTPAEETTPAVIPAEPTCYEWQMFGDIPSYLGGTDLKNCQDLCQQTPGCLGINIIMLDKLLCMVVDDVIDIDYMYDNWMYKSIYWGRLVETACSTTSMPAEATCNDWLLIEGQGSSSSGVNYGAIPLEQCQDLCLKTPGCIAIDYLIDFDMLPASVCHLLVNASDLDSTNTVNLDYVHQYRLVKTACTSTT